LFFQPLFHPKLSEQFSQYKRLITVFGELENHINKIRLNRVKEITNDFDNDIDDFDNTGNLIIDKIGSLESCLSIPKIALLDKKFDYLQDPIISQLIIEKNLVDFCLLQ